MRHFGASALVVLLAVINFSSSVEAQELTRPKWELTGSSSASVDIVSTSNPNAGNYTQANVSGTVGYFQENSPLEWLANLTFRLRTPSGGTDIPLIGAAYNFSPDISNSFVASVLAGLNLYASNGNTRQIFSSFVYRISLAKRTQLLPNVSWLPEIAYYDQAAARHERITLYHVSRIELNLFRIGILF